MRFEFEDDDLERLYTDPSFHDPRFGAHIIKLFRKRMQFIGAALDDRDLRNYRGLHFEKLGHDRQGQHSIQLDQQFRLILRLYTDEEGRRSVSIVEITDYH